ncbi:MAG: hypothetical protein HYT34_00835 [Candidatus Ryanbacteria bacterium]|nr:hypothetical protein [Candidatus Ryanbacteria bacterium]
MDIYSKQKEKTRYRANINAIKKILSGKSRTLKKELARRMQTLAEKRKYEEARIARDQLASLERIFEHSPYLKKEITEERARALLLLKDLIGLAKVPRRIEGYDISHHQGSSSVGSMVVFENGMPQKNAYRKFIIRSVSGINDPAMMGEVLVRRLAHTEWEIPDLILIDGGKAQLGAARASVAKNIPLAALAKREEELYMPGKSEPIRLMALSPPLLYLLTSIRDEAHRFAVSFHRKRQHRLVLKS